ncbi:ABC transporter permease [Nitratireductor mangrovi]|uniref:ABC transporter permease n=1 Tax=Nitratireductor mangrovi TaxID=2599600 RepID=A0A5B8L086_9HYPH|nr:ABC transporter permease [Nitratireductor mangrovi]QDZ01299.2 ABC transporter permease [Nitratireductor mangrovi]
MVTAASRKLPAFAAIGFALLLVVGAILLAGADPLALAGSVVQRALLTNAGFLEALLRAIPLTIMGLGIALAFRARIFNIGMDGQLIAGSVAAVALAPWLPGGPVGMLAFLVIGLAGGAFWGGVAGVIKARFGGNEIISTIMLNYVAIQILSWLVRGPMQEKMRIIPRSDPIDASLRLPVLFEGTRIHAGLIVVVIVVALSAAVVARGRFGFKLAVVGQNPDAAHYAGISPSGVAGIVLAISGGLAGLAGAVEISGVYGRLQEGFAPGFGISAIAVALVARLNPLLVPVSALGFSLLYAGLGSVAQKGMVPFPMINIIESAIILVFLAGSTIAIRSGRAKEV